MFERYLTDALTKHFGHLVEDVDAEKVRVSAWNGSLLLEDVFLRTDALDGFFDKCPVELAYGKVGRLDVQVPWTLVGSQLWRRKTTKNAPGDQEAEPNESTTNVSVTLSDVNILITPRRKGVAKKDTSNGTATKGDDKDEMDEEKIQRKARERKEKVVQEMLDAQLLSRVAASSQVTTRWKWVQDWLSNLLSSLTVTARNIHIRYEDPGNSMGFVWNSNAPKRVRQYRKAFAIGITLGGFSVKTAAASKQTMTTTEKSSLEASKSRLSDDDSTNKEGCEINSVVSMPSSTQSSTPERPSAAEAQGEEEEERPPSKEHEIRSKIAATKMLAIYWDTDGCFLISQRAQTNDNNNSQSTNMEPVLERAYVDSAFSILNSSEENDNESVHSTFADRAIYQKPHAYLLDPVSPTVKFDLVTENGLSAAPTLEGDGAVQQHAASSSSYHPSFINATTMPSSSVNVSLPPTLFFISRQTLEDIAYLRKSLDAWMHTKKGILSDKTLRRLAKLRPLQLAVHNPRGWWKYAAEATIAFIKVGRQQDAIHGGKHDTNTNDQQAVPNGNQPASKRGWLGLARALGKRRQYVALYKELYSAEEKSNENEAQAIIAGPVFPREQKLHHSLLELEDELSAPEIAAFRIAAYNEVVRVAAHGVDDDDGSVATKWQPPEIHTNHASANNPFEYLSLEHRCQMFAEMAEALDRERLNTTMREKEERGNVETEEDEGSLGPSVSALGQEDPAVWKISVSSTELSLQVNDQHQSSGSVPIVRLSAACVLECNLYRSSSWEVDCAIAALTMQDLANAGQHQEQPELDMYQLRTLIGPKLAEKMQLNKEDLIEVDGTSFQESIRVVLRRNRTVGQMGSTTYTRIRLSPLEIIYSTVPFEALSRVLAAVKTPELSDDYHRMASRVYEWRERQKKRLLQALAHREKIMHVNVDVAAPVLLIPETIGRTDSPLLVIDLGQLQFSNTTNNDESLTKLPEFDDAWQLVLKNIQVQCTTTMLYRQMMSSALEKPQGSQETRQSPQHVVEGFSLEFSILTMVADEGDEARIKLAATLPRLSFNITSSSVRLINRLQSQWSQRKYELKTEGRTEAFAKTRRPSSLRASVVSEDVSRIDTSSKADLLSPSKPQASKKVRRFFEFHFSAPLITVKLENDVDGRIIPGKWATGAMKLESTPITSLSLRGIGGSLVRKVEASGSASSKFEARLHSLLAVDHYQTAGSDSSLLLSSLEPTTVLNNAGIHDELLWWHNSVGDDQPSPPQHGKDLVLVEFTGREDAEVPEADGEKLSIQFHELYVEWNPETIAALQKAVRTPTSHETIDDNPSSPLSNNEDAVSEGSEDEFHDAQEDIFFDSNSTNTDRMATPLKYLTRESTKSLMLFSQKSSMSSANFEITTPPSSRKRFEVVFNLSKLSVNFNKESRHRRLLRAEMDRTFIQYQTRDSGGSKTIARLGNLILSDPTSRDCNTLYSQILGLQTDAKWKPSSELSSLLEMEIVSNPRSRNTINTEAIDNGTSELQSVSICYDDGSVHGCDTHIRAHLSPMRFVYLSQLWSEIVDYFFEGIMGYEVMGKTRPKPNFVAPNQEEPRALVDIDPSLVSFTRFNIVIESPEVLFPVTYRSSQFLKLFAASITIANFFECKRREDDIARWHNNCTISFESLRIFSWDSKEITHSEKNVGADIDLRWPVGPLAPQEIPKWNVACNFDDSLDLTLRRDDYALLQNIVSHNISEESRNLDEWAALQNLTADELKQYKQSIMVHFGYDAKDVAPTTYSLKNEMPLVSLALEADDGAIVAIIACSSFQWKMKKADDRISRQQVTCNIEMTHPKAGEETEVLLSFNHSAQEQGKSQSELTYTSTSDPTGNNVKTLEIVNSCIYVYYPGWIELTSWFSGMPEAEVFTVEQVGLSMQVGDRWYMIAKPLDVANQAKEDEDTGQRKFSWIGKDGCDDPTLQDKAEDATKPSFQLRILLSSPCIVLSAASSEFEGETTCVLLRLAHLDFLHINDAVAGTITKAFFLHDLQLNTASLQGNRYGTSEAAENSLIHPWCVAVKTTRCNAPTCSCDMHSFRVHADVLRARAAFSDMMIAINVCLGLVSDVRQSRAKNKSSAPESSDKGGYLAADPEDGALSSQSAEISILGPSKHVMTVEWDGFELLVVDDSGRHFAGSQELITLMLGRMQLWRKETRLLQKDENDSDNIQNSCRTTARLDKLDLLDCLQPQNSPFRAVAAIRSKYPEQEEVENCEAVTNGRMDWTSFTMQASDQWGFSASPSLVKSLRPVPLESTETEEPSILYDSFDDGRNSKTYSIKVRFCNIQYNPSTVIALQRFMGRFRKHAVQSIDAFNEEFDKLMEASYDPELEESQSKSVPKIVERNVKITMKIQLEKLHICLNKEHQNRRLLVVSVSDCNTSLCQHRGSMTLEGGVGDLRAWDCDLKSQLESDTMNANNTCVMRALTTKELQGGEADRSFDKKAFLKYRYHTFSDESPFRHHDGVQEIPQWVLAHLGTEEGTSQCIDDYLEVSVSAVEITYLRETTEEILDYLSNGLPGKGMGATSKAAQGFLEKRIQTRSFLHVLIESPSVLIPQHGLATAGIRLQLGDIDLGSWFEGGSAKGRIQDIDLHSAESLRAPKASSDGVNENHADWWRMLSLKITNFSAGMFENANSSLCYADVLNQPLDLSLILQKSAWHKKIFLRCRISLIEMTLRYSSYCMLHKVLEGNLGQVIDKRKWANIEKAYAREMKEAEGQDEFLKPVKYASGAKFVKFGVEKKSDGKGNHLRNSVARSDSTGDRKGLVELHFQLDGFTVKFNRDDRVAEHGSRPYDMLLLKVQMVDISVSNRVSEDYSLQLALYRIGLFDLGDRGRMERENLFITDGSLLEARRPCAFAVLVEGYSNMSEQNRAVQNDSTKEGREMEPQLVITVDTVPASSAGTIGSLDKPIQQHDGKNKVTVAKVVLNYLSVNALVRPFTELADFLTLSWPDPNQVEEKDDRSEKPAVVKPLRSDSSRLEEPESNGSPDEVRSSISCLQVKLVAHHPRIFFVADESDTHSRALVLRGLAVVNAGRTTMTEVDSSKQSDLVVDAQLHSLESYINADVKKALGLQKRHTHLLSPSEVSLFTFPGEEYADQASTADDDDLGIALLQPVTSGIEYGKTSRPRFPSRRFLCINVEPISTMLSFSDLQLIESVLNRWVRQPSDKDIKRTDELPSNGQQVATHLYTDNERDVDNAAYLPFDVVVYQAYLGLALRKAGNHIVVDEVLLGSECSDVRVGDRLARIAGKLVSATSLDEVVSHLAEEARPTTLTLLRLKAASAVVVETMVAAAPSEDTLQRHSLQSKMTLHFKTGVSNGLAVEMSSIAGIPVVTTVYPCIADGMLASNAPEQQIPRSGALVIGLDGKNILDVDCSLALNFISSNGLMEEEENPSHGRDTYSLTFEEIEESDWACFDLSLQGGVVTFIDDLNGRDMPLVRASLKAAEIHFKKGIGLQTFILERIKDFSFMSNSSCGNIEADGSVTLSAFAKTSLDFYHPRNALYEPLLEPAQFCVNYESHTRNDSTGRPGQVALEVSDHSLQDLKASSKDHEPHLICVNISDSSVEVLAKALREWELWRKMVQDSYVLSNLPDLLPGKNGTYPSESSSWTGTRTSPTASLVGKNGNIQKPEQAAASSAAQAAFIFAQKRGADRSGKSEFSKPFVFRNRTGVSIAFVQQETTKHAQRKTKTKAHYSFVGEYGGLEHYDRADVTELADGEDARFQMEVLGRRHTETAKKVRTYDGQLPRLTVAIQAIAGVTVEAIDGLQVQKAGKSIRHVPVTTEDDFDSSKSAPHSVPVVWSVEVEDNRRILTLSSAVRIISLNSTVGIEIGVQNFKSLVSHHDADNNNNNVQYLGVSLPDMPYYLPIWLAMRREFVRVYVRPKFGGPSEYQWGNQSVLEFGQAASVDSTKSWIWQDTLEEALGSILCQAKEDSTPAAFLSCYSSALVANKRQLQGVNSTTTFGLDELSNEILSVSIDSGLSLRNLLPVDVEWEAAHGFGPDLQSPVDGSTVRFQESFAETTALKSGECADVYACNFKLESLKTRFKLKNMLGWSEWAIVSSPIKTLESTSRSEASQSEEVNQDPSDNLSAFQTNVQITDAFGVPVTIGVRVVPKIAKSDRNESNLTCYGVDVIIYAELWISNLTELPLTFGCPERQIYDKGDEEFEFEDEATKFTAEAALMEMASVLEIGEKGTGMDTRTANMAAAAGEVYILPHQINSCITEEIFEFIEVDGSTVKRRWWGSESYWNLRNSEILDVGDGGRSWHWIHDEWKIDYTGRSLEASGGWESCKDLLGIGEGPFSGLRQFTPTHPFRRRRWFRTRATNPSNALPSDALFDQTSSRVGGPSLLSGLQAFHHPICDSFSRAQQKAMLRRKRKKSQSCEKEDERQAIELNSANTYRISIKCGDGKWSVPVTVSSLGKNHGDIHVYASRWPTLTKSVRGGNPQMLPVGTNPGLGSISSAPPNHGVAPLDPTLYDLVYLVVDVEGEWGEFSRHMMVSARFSVRNDSKKVAIEIKQAGTSDESAIMLSPGEISPFYWSDFRLPRLVCVRPANTRDDEQKVYKWSGGFDVYNLGMTALLIRQVPGGSSKCPDDKEERIRSIRTLVELRPGTGGAGFNVSFKEEREDGDGALFRIENMSTFNIWLSQDGVLANPSMSLPHDTSEQDGDLIRPGERISFGLEVPYRQGKYAGRRAATMAELLRVRVGLAPLSTRAGIETTKVIGLAVIGESIRLKPSKLVTILNPEQRKMLERVRILAVTAVDGPSRVLKFSPMAYPQVDNGLGSVLMESVTYSPPDEFRATGPHVQEIIAAASATESMLIEKKLPSETEAKRRALFGGERAGKPEPLLQPTSDETTVADTHYSVRFSFSGFIFSLLDSSPSEICTVAIDHINAIAKWNQLRTLSSSLLMSIGWLQVDNHIPSAPFPVAICPEGNEARECVDDVINPIGSGDGTQQSSTPPLLFIGVEIAPKHSSGIVCLKSVTVAPRSMVVSLDLAFLVRLQRYASGLHLHFQPQKVLTAEVTHKGRSGHQLFRTRAIPTPDIHKRIQEVEDAAATGVGRQQVFFGALAVLPFTIMLSVAPARALTPAQEAFEGLEAAAIHKAVRKGDFFMGRNSYPLGLVVGRKNKTALSVVQGVFKSIVVDVMIRMDGASLNLAGAFLRNQIFSGPQLATYLAAHYMYSLRQNVPTLLGSMAAFGNPLGLFRGIGDGMNDFVSEPVKGIKKSIAKLDPKYAVDGVAKGTDSLARHTVGGFAGSAALLTSTFSKNMAVLTLDRRYAQKRDRGNNRQFEEHSDWLLLDGVESGFVKLAQGFIEGVTGVVKAPLRGAERSGFEGFAKGLGKGLLGLLVKPVIGISDAATDLFIGVKSSVEGDRHHVVDQRHQVRPRRALYGWERQLRIYNLADAAACALMLRTCIGGQSFLSHLDMDERVALLSDKRLLLLDSEGQKLLLVKFKHISKVEVRQFGDSEFTVLIMLSKPCNNGSEVEVINSCKNKAQAQELCGQINHGIRLLETM